MSPTPPRKLGGVALADQETAQQRMTICQNCPHATGGKETKYFCSKCGCVLAGKTKLHKASCPVGKW